VNLDKEDVDGSKTELRGKVESLAHDIGYIEYGWYYGWLYISQSWTILKEDNKCFVGAGQGH
jgi:hypothetical protein